jgi:CheY-like chemotaxis protein
MAHRLLLADDSVTVQRVIELTFADEDIQVVAVSDGDAAIARLEQERFDVVLADIDMPGRSGYDVARFVKDRPPEARPPVILLTGAFEPVDHVQVAEVGAAAVLAKPFEPQMVIAKVRELLGKPRDLEPPAAIPPTLPPAPQPPGGTVDEYFDRLDRAFATLNAPLEPRHLHAQDDDADTPPGLPAHPAATGAAADAEPEPTSLRHHVSTPHGDTDASARRARPDLADRFATLLAVEQGELPPSALAPAESADDELVDRIARRVVEALGDRAVRDMAADIVSRTAERLVREEIERIKAGV